MRIGPTSGRGRVNTQWTDLRQQIRTHRLAQKGGDLELLLQLLKESGCTEPRILDVGSGGRRITPGAIGLDMRRGAGVDLQADATRLPIRSGSCDAAVATDVLMYVQDPAAAAAELIRVLKPGGIIFAAEPFLYPDMGSGTMRFTSRGLAGLFASCEILHQGHQRGPSSALLPLLTYYIATLFSFNNFTLYRIIVRILLILLYPLVFTDRALMGYDRIPNRLYTNCVAYVRKPANAPVGGEAQAGVQGS